MRETLKYGATLMILAGLLSSVLAFVYGITEPRRLEIIEEQKIRAVSEVLPFAEHFVEEKWYVKGYETETCAEPSGYAFSVKGSGYSSTVETMVGVSRLKDAKTFEISGIKIISQQETPGLGSRIEEIPASVTLAGILLGKGAEAPEKPPLPWFQEQFKSKSADDLRINGIDAVTGATITTDAVVNSVREGIKKLEEEIFKP